MSDDAQTQRYRCTKGHMWEESASTLTQPNATVTAPWDPGVQLCQRCLWESLKTVAGRVETDNAQREDET